MDKLILAEDDMLLRELYSTVLQKSGFTVIAAEDGEAAITAAQSNLDAKLLLLDIMLPKIHGIEVLKQLKSAPLTQHLPIVLLTNLTEESIVQEAMRLGANGFLIKVKFTPQQLVDKIKEILNGATISQT